MIVMMILATLTAMVSPVFRDSLRHMRAENAVRDLQAACSYAQSRAVTDSAEVRLNIDHKKHAYWISRAYLNDKDEVVFKPLSETDFPTTILPETIVLTKPKARFDRDQKTHYIAFYPEGLCESAKLTLNLVDEPRQKYWIEMSGTRVTMERSKT
jgi:Tfp pilus assembly protein FimT